jgi:type VI secretion system protein ImpJ
MTKSSFAHIVPTIQWHEGMMLTPQHFQQLEIRNYQLLSSQINLLSSCHWGVGSYTLDTLTLPDGLFRITEISAIMPDGLVVSYASHMQGMRPLEVDMSPYRMDFPREGLTVFLCIQARRSEVSPLLGDYPRFLSIDWNEVMDENLGDNPIQIPRLFPNLYLHIGEQPPPEAVAFPLAKVDFVDEVFTLKHYTPPCFFIAREGYIWKRCAHVVQIMREKIAFLCERWQNQVGTPLSYETEAMLRPMMMALPAFETMVHSPEISPYTLYQRLCQTIGYLCTLRLAQVPPLIPPYQHNNINASFVPMLDLMDEYLRGIDNTFAAFPFMQKDRLYSIRLHKSYGESALFVGLKAPRGMTEAQMEEWMHNAVIGSDSALDVIQMRRVTGAVRQLMRDEDLYDIMPSRGVVVFKITVDGDFVRLDQKLNIFNPGDTPERRPADMMLFVRKGPGAEV